MNIGFRWFFLFTLLLLASCARTPLPPTEHEVAVQELSLGEIQAHRQIVATVSGYTGVCERLEVRQRLEGRTFYLTVVGIYTNPANTPCPELAQEFTRQVTLELYGLAAGDYTVRAGDLSRTFSVPAQAVSEALVDKVSVALLESNPVQVVATAEGSLRSGCEEIGDISQRFEENTFFVTILAVAPWSVDCTPVAPPFTERVTLETRSLPPGTYKVDVNGLAKTFTLP